LCDPAQAAPAEKPNIVFIMVDDLGYGDLGCYGQKQIKTPNLDRMASEGMRFTQFYAGSTVCAPSRCVLMTGIHTGRALVRGNRETKPMGQHPLPPDTLTVAKLLKRAGYATGLVGKWGLGGPDTTGEPNRQGLTISTATCASVTRIITIPSFCFVTVIALCWRATASPNLARTEPASQSSVPSTATI
jgi:arylsulfatase A-like enzyme